MEPINVSDSRTNVWNFCPKSWGLQYVDGWKPIVKSKYLNKGSWFHEGVELALNILVSKGTEYAKCSTDDLIDRFESMEEFISTLIHSKCEVVAMKSASAGTLTDERADDLEEQRDASVWMVKHYLRNLAPLLAHKMIIGIEVKFEDVFEVRSVSYRKKLKNRGVIDLLLFDPFDKTILVVDQKSAADLLDAEKRLTYSVQHVGYVRWVKGMVESGKIMDVLGSNGKVTVDLTDAKVRAVFRIVRSKMPRVPKTLKNGTISSAAISTVRSVYKEALLNQVQEPTEKQLDRMAMLPETWTNSVEPVVTDADIKLWEVEMSVVAVRMEEARHLPMYQTRNTRNCHECRLVNVCQLGDDPDFEQTKAVTHKEGAGKTIFGAMKENAITQ